jgi:hypothetical protein
MTSSFISLKVVESHLDFQGNSPSTSFPIRMEKIQEIMREYFWETVGVYCALFYIINYFIGSKRNL